MKFLADFACWVSSEATLCQWRQHGFDESERGQELRELREQRAPQTVAGQAELDKAALRVGGGKLGPARGTTL